MFFIVPDSVTQKTVKLLQGEIDGLQDGAHIATLSVGNLTNSDVLHVHANSPLLSRRQLFNRLIKLIHLGAADVRFLDAFGGMLLPDFQNVFERSTASMARFFPERPAAFLLQFQPLLIQIIAHRDFLNLTVIILDFDRFHFLPPSRQLLNSNQRPGGGDLAL